MASSAHSPKSPWELYRIAKKQGAWDPEDIPIGEDRRDWQKLTPGQREQLVKICALFYEGEVSVADTLAWFIIAMPEQDRRAFLATQVIEEVKHAEFFALYFREIFGHVDTQKYLVPEYRGVLLDELKQRGEAMGRAVVAGDHLAAERELVLGMAHYMGVIEGMMAVSGYDYFDEMLGARGIFPRLLEGIRLIRADEGRHLTHGMDYLRKKIAEKAEYADPVRALFMEQAMKIPARTDFVFQPNDFGLDHGRMMAIGYEHLAQRSREAGLQ